MRLLLITVLMFALAAAVLASAPAASAISCEGYYGQTGTAADPFRVDSVAKLEGVDDCDGSNVHFLQAVDLDLGGTPWTPLGTSVDPFIGTYDGGGRRIVGLVVDETSAAGSPKGLFGAVDGGTVRNLTIEGARIEGIASYYGVVVGDLDDGLVEDVRVTRSTVTSTDQALIGGIAGGATGSVMRRLTVDSVAIVVNATAYDIGGVTGQAWSTSIERVTVRDFTVSGLAVFVGGVTGRLFNGSVVDASVIGGSIFGERVIGGIVGQSCSSTVMRASSTASVVAEVEHAGGAVGAVGDTCPTSAFSAPDVVISDVEASGDVTAGSGAGGLVGWIGNGTIQRAYATGRVTATGTAAGGLIGSLRGGTIVDAYATGDVSAALAAGGLVGQLDPAGGAVVERTYATGRVSAVASAGGLIGEGSVCPVSVINVCGVRAAAAASTASFWNTETTGQAATYGGATGRTTAQMRDRATFADAGWAIVNGWEAPGTNVWGICQNDGYPFLLRQYDIATQPCAGPPGAPLRPRLSANGGALRVHWESPTSDGGAPVTGYTATANAPAGGKTAARTCSTDGSGRRCVITGLRNGTLYRITVTATNRKGIGAAATAAGRPRPSLTILRARVVGGAIITHLRVTAPGRLQQVGRRGAAVACQTRTTAQRAGVIVLTCPLDVKTRTATRAIVRLTTRFRPTGWRWTTDLRAVARGGGSAPVTG